MTAQPENRSKWLKVRLTPAEQKLLDQKYKRTTFQNLSAYGRALILGEPVTIIHRDRTMDEMLEEMIGLRRELNAIGNNLNQAVKNINRLHGLPDSRLWMTLLGVIKNTLEPSIDHIKEQMNKYSTIWSQGSKAGKA